jgi:hypothetical protein
MPDEALWANRYSVVNFRADPALADEEASKKKRRHQEGSTAGREDGTESAEVRRKRNKVLKSIITNDRLVEDDRYLISLIEPKDEVTAAKQEGEYTWLRDCSLEQRDPRDTLFVLMIDPDPEPEPEGEYSQLQEEMGCTVDRSTRLCTYVPVNSNMRLERLPALKSEPHSATVRRRFMDPWERKDRATTLAEVWPVVLPDISSELPDMRPTDLVEMEEPTSAAVTTVPQDIADMGEEEEEDEEESGGAVERSAGVASKATKAVSFEGNVIASVAVVNVVLTPCFWSVQTSRMRRKIRSIRSTRTAPTICWTNHSKQHKRCQTLVEAKHGLPYHAYNSLLRVLSSHQYHAFFFFWLSLPIHS